MIERPWGAYHTYAMNQPCTVKLLHVDLGERLSLQYHKHREEMWIALHDGVLAEVNGETVSLDAYDEYIIPAGVTHRLYGYAQVLEVAFGPFDEDDIVRLEDDYGRD